MVVFAALRIVRIAAVGEDARREVGRVIQHDVAVKERRQVVGPLPRRQRAGRPPIAPAATKEAVGAGVAGRSPNPATEPEDLHVWHVRAAGVEVVADIAVALRVVFFLLVGPRHPGRNSAFCCARVAAFAHVSSAAGAPSATAPTAVVAMAVHTACRAQNAAPGIDNLDDVQQTNGCAHTISSLLGVPGLLDAVEQILERSDTSVCAVVKWFVLVLVAEALLAGAAFWAP